MINSKLNLLNLLSNFVISKICDQLLNNDKKDLYDQYDLNLINFLNEGLKRFPTEFGLNFHYKLFISYFLTMFSEYFQKNDIDILKRIVDDVENEEIDKILHFDLLQKFKIVLCKRLNQLIKSQELDVNSECYTSFKKFLDNNDHYLMFDEQDQDQDQYIIFTNDLFYKDVCKIVKNYICPKNESVIFDMIRYYDFTNEKDEPELINSLTWLRKKRDISELIIENNDSSLSSTSIERLKSQSNKKQRLENVEGQNQNQDILNQSKEQQSSEPNENINTSQAEKSPTIHLRLQTSLDLKSKQNSPDVNSSVLKSDTEIEKLNGAEASHKPISPVKQKSKTIKLKKIASRQLLQSKMLLQSGDEEENDNSMDKKKSAKKNESTNDDSEDDREFMESPSSKLKRLPLLAKPKINLFKNNSKMNQLTSSPKIMVSRSSINDYFNNSIEKTARLSNKKSRTKNNLNDDKAPSDESVNKSKNETNTENSDKENDKSIILTDQPMVNKKLNSSSDNYRQNDMSVEDVSDNDDEDDLTTKTYANDKISTRCSRSLSSNRKWDDLETIYLLVGVKIYGAGSWAKILSEFSQKFKNRTSVNLKDKYRNLLKFDAMTKFQRQVNAIVETLKAAKSPLTFRKANE